MIRGGPPVINRRADYVNQDGSVVHGLVTKTPLRDEDGTVIGTYGVSRNVTELLEAVGQVHRQLHHRIDTGKLNRHLERWLDRTPPPVRGRGRLKIRYITQVQRLPVTFIAFVNRKKGFPESYIGYLKNQIRADFGLSSIPFTLELRER